MRRALLGVLGERGAPAPGPVELAISATLAVLVVAAVGRWGVPEPSWARNWLGLGRLATSGVARPAERLARALARFDDAVLDRGVEVTAACGAACVARAARTSTGAGVDAGVERGRSPSVRPCLGGLARRPQTGLLHHYYVQAVAVLAAGAVLLLLVR